MRPTPPDFWYTCSMDSVVAIDIETTGLDAERDAIIEIAAVKFKGSRVEEEWSSLINPNRHVPEFITSLTGIDDAMLREAPRFREVAHHVEAFWSKRFERMITWLFD